MRLPEYLRDWCTNAGRDWQVADRLHLRAPPFDARHIDPRRGLAKQNRANEISSLNEPLIHLNNAANYPKKQENLFTSGVCRPCTHASG